MKMNYLKIVKPLIALALLFASPSTYAQNTGNGGDICADHILSIAADIDAWIAKGHGRELDLRQNISLQNYEQGMHAAFQTTKISCTHKKVKIGRSERTCKNFLDSHHVNRIVCNRAAFEKETSDSDQYVLIHHEYAGVAGFEKDSSKETSDFTISRQLSKKGRQVLVYKLAVDDNATQACAKDYSLVNGACVAVTGRTFTLSSGYSAHTVTQFCQAVPLTVSADENHQVSGTGSSLSGCTESFIGHEENGTITVSEFVISLPSANAVCKYDNGYLIVNGNSLTGMIGSSQSNSGDSVCGSFLTIDGTKTN